jgi:hypothetical protein
VDQEQNLNQSAHQWLVDPKDVDKTIIGSKENLSELLLALLPMPLICQSHDTINSVNRWPQSTIFCLITPNQTRQNMCNKIAQCKRRKHGFESRSVDRRLHFAFWDDRFFRINAETHAKKVPTRKRRWIGTDRNVMQPKTVGQKLRAALSPLGLVLFSHVDMFMPLLNQFSSFVVVFHSLPFDQLLIASSLACVRDESRVDEN